MIYDNTFFFTCGEPIHVINELENLLAKYKNINGVIIRGKFMGTIEPLTAKIKQHIYIQKYQYDSYAEQYLMVWNKDANYTIDAETVIKIIDSIIKY